MTKKPGNVPVVGMIVLPLASPNPMRRRAANVAGLPVVAVFVALLVKLMYPAAAPDFQNFGTVQTRFGPAALVCGGEGGEPCGTATTVRFDQCSPALNAFATSPARLRSLVGRIPPSGNTFAGYTCAAHPGL